MRRVLLREVPGLISVSNLRVLRAVQLREGGPEGPTVRDVALDLDVEHSTASREVSAVVAQGYLTKSTSAADLRRTCLALTEEGRTALHAATNARLTWLEQSLQEWSDNDLRTLLGLLDRLVDDYASSLERP